MTNTKYNLRKIKYRVIIGSLVLSPLLGPIPLLFGLMFMFLLGCIRAVCIAKGNDPFCDY